MFARSRWVARYRDEFLPLFVSTLQHNCDSGCGATWSRLLQRVAIGCLIILTHSYKPRAHAQEPAPPISLERFAWLQTRDDLKIASAASCAANACHGGPSAGVARAGAIRGSEYPLWLTRDPHARAYLTLCTPASTAMLRRLNIMQADKVVDQAGFENCLACHNSTRQFSANNSASDLREGVGCSSCHGPSELWRETHYLADWPAASALDDGFAPLKNMLARARICATCHVGGRDRDMNHDIIAAGHPPLHYEFATFHERQPRHWRDPGENQTQRYEAQQWLVGQVAALDASLVLLEARAEQTLPLSQWPEFAALDCASCHQQLRIGRVDYAVDQAGIPGQPNYSRWNRWGMQSLLQLRHSEGHKNAVDHSLSDALDRLSRLMSTRESDPADASQAAAVARRALDTWINSPAGQSEMNGFSAERLRGLIGRAGQDPANAAAWETATQFYLASIAGRAAWPEHDPLRAESDPRLTAQALRDALTFRPGTQSPQSATLIADAPRSANQTGSLDGTLQRHWQAIAALPAPARAADMPPPLSGTSRSEPGLGRPQPAETIAPRAAPTERPDPRNP